MWLLRMTIIINSTESKRGKAVGEGAVVGAVIMIIAELNSHRGPTCDGMHGRI